jgi:hypothetical protein
MHKSAEKRSNILIGKSEKKRACGWHKHTWEGNIKMDVKGRGYLTQLDQDEIQ